MKMLTSIPVLLLLAANTAAAPVKVDGRGESWVHVLTEKNRWNMRIDGGPLTQDKGEFRRDPNEKKWKPVPDSRSRAYGYLFGDGKRMIYAEEDPESKKHGAKFDLWRHRVMIADADGKNPKQVFTGLKWNGSNPAGARFS